ncbi:MAG TPA: UDP-N-acetylglucosamine 2-epimerase [Steroidobacteraceae bacterium]|nr:UDP-N-acetylglucosamine 2-epimerase [Steroidobacteraceae bacterium]
MSRTRRICVVTGSRAEYGLLRWVMAGIRERAGLELRTLVTGMHLSEHFGATWSEIEADGFAIDERVDIQLGGDTASDIGRSMGLGTIGCADALARLKPDLLVALGDRYEIFAAVSPALIARIPVAHLHGGEVTEGAYDDALRHALTKMSHLHFVAAEEYRRRVIQLGEDPRHVFNVGGLGLDNLELLPLFDRAALERELGFELGAKSLLVTFHPVTLDGPDSARQMRELLAALHDRPDTRLVFTMPNADSDGRALGELVREFVAGHANARVFTSLGQKKYLSCLRAVDGVVGNSSSGLIEAPAARKGTVNIGSRQQGRLKAASVIDCAPDRAAISRAIDTLYTADFQRTLATVANPYGTPGAARRVVDVLADVPLDGLTRKKFHDIGFAT